MLGEGVAAPGRVEQIPREDRKVEIELFSEFVLPLLDERTRRNDQAALQVAPQRELLDEEPGHDRLSGAGVVGEQEAQRVTVEHRAIDGGDLMGQRFDLGGVDREVRIEEVSKANPLGLCGKEELLRVGGEGTDRGGTSKFEA